MNQASIVTGLVLAHPPERVWRAITDPVRIAEWLMPNDFLPVTGHRFTLTTRPVPPHFDGKVRCEVLAVEPPHRLVYRWCGGGIDTEVRFTLDPQGEGEGTRLRLEHAGFDLDRPGDAVAYRGMEPGWTRHMGARLREVLDAMAV